MTFAIGEQYVVDERGTPVSVLLNIRTYRKIVQDLEELAAIRAYDATKAYDDEAIPFEQAVKEIERARR